jgi:hypothetical protein
MKRNAKGDSNVAADAGGVRPKGPRFLRNSHIHEEWRPTTLMAGANSEFDGTHQDGRAPARTRINSLDRYLSGHIRMPRSGRRAATTP